MTQFSMFHSAPTFGHGANRYTQEQLWEWLRYTFVVNPATQGPFPVSAVFPAPYNATAGSLSVTISPGAALVFGCPAWSTANVPVGIPQPAGGTRIDRIVLRLNWTTREALITRLAGTEGGAAPAITQNAGALWDLPLWQVSITTAGAITLTDQRDFIRSFGMVDVNRLQSNINASGIGFRAADSDRLAGQLGSFYTDAVNAHIANNTLHTTVQAFPAGTDFNGWITQGTYHGQFTAALTNEPLAGGTNSRWLTLEVQAFSGNIAQHLRYELDWNNRRIFWRQRDSVGVWNSWVEVWNSASRRQLYAGDETETSVTGTTNVTRKSIRMVHSTAHGTGPLTRLGVVAELRATAGTAFAEIFANGVSLFTLSTTSTAYVLVQNTVSVAWPDNSVNLVELRLRNSGAATTFNRVFEVYV